MDFQRITKVLKMEETSLPVPQGDQLQWAETEDGCFTGLELNFTPLKARGNLSLQETQQMGRSL